MKRKLIVKLLTICICVTLIGVVTVSALSSEKVSEMVSNFFAAGQYFKQANDSKGNSTNTQDAVLAKYKDTAITALTVEYQKNMNIIRSEELANKNQTDRDVIDNIIENLILLEEAERLGLAATEDEIEAIVLYQVGAIMSFAKSFKIFFVIFIKRKIQNSKRVYICFCL